MAIENSKSSNPPQFSDLARVRGLSAALQRVFDELSADLRPSQVESVPGCASIRKGSRHSHVTTLSERNFHIDLWCQGVQYGSGWTSDLREVARTAVAFHLETAAINDIAARFEWLNPNEQAASHEQGAEFFVTKKWQDLQRWVASDQRSHLYGLVSLVLEAAKRPELRRLLPFTSLALLCFSRTTGYPYSHDCPIAWAVMGGLFRVAATDQQTILGEGDAARAADLLVANLPQNCGPAIHGTAEDLKLPSRD